MVIGLSGKYCAGKNVVAAVFAEKAIPEVDVDKLGHLALAARIEQVEAAFGSEVIKSSGEVDRQALGSQVFTDPVKLERLEKIIHPWMIEETIRQVEKYQLEGSRHVVINAAILYKMGLHKICDLVIWVEAPLFARIKRAMKRDHLNLPAVLKRIFVQRSLKTKSLEKYVDIYKVGNRTGIDSVRNQIENILAQIEQKGSNGR